MSIFIGGRLDGRRDFEVPPSHRGDLLVPWHEFYPGHPLYVQGVSVYRFDASESAWVYVGES